MTSPLKPSEQTLKDVTWLDSDTLDGLEVSPGAVVAAIESAIRGCHQGHTWSSPKSGIRLDDGRYFMSTMAISDQPGLMSVKALVMNPANPERGLPQINSLITLLDSDSGIPKAILDGNWITAVRTAGLSALAATKLAKPDSRHIALVGCGVQARSHLDALAALFPVEQVSLFGRGEANIKATRARAEHHGLSVSVCDEPRESVAAADIVVSSISYDAGTRPFIDAGWMRPGAFAAIADLGIPWIKAGFACLDMLVIDDLVQERTMSAPLVPGEEIAGDLNDLVLGRLNRSTSPAARSAFIFRGQALGDFAVSALAYEKAMGINT